MRGCNMGASTPNWGCCRQQDGDEGMQYRGQHPKVGVLQAGDQGVALPALPTGPARAERAGSPGAVCAACTARPSPRDGAARPALASSGAAGLAACPACGGVSVCPALPCLGWGHSATPAPPSPPG